MNTTKIGLQAEEKAVRLLEQDGYRIIERNVRTRRGELDIVAWDGRVLCFVEVRYTKTLAFGGPLATVRYEKKRRIIRAAQDYLRDYRKGAQCRFDVVGLWDEGHALIKGAFIADR